MIDSGYQHVLTMTERIQDNVVPSNEMSSHQTPGNNISAGEGHSTRKRRRKIMYFNPPYSCFIRNNIGKYFLNMIKTHFRQGTLLGKLFNRNNLKLSYSCFLKSSPKYLRITRSFCLLIMYLVGMSVIVGSRLIVL